MSWIRLDHIASHIIGIFLTTAIDEQTRFVVTKTVPDLSADTVEKLVYEQIILRFGAPKVIKTDHVACISKTYIILNCLNF